MKPFQILMSYVLATVAFALPGGGMMVGGRSPSWAAASDPEVVFAMKKINEFFATQENDGIRTLERIVNAESRVVSGVSYSYRLEISGGSQGKEFCDVQVWSRPWLEAPNDMKMTKNIGCEVADSVSKRSVEDSSAPDAQNALLFFEKFINSRFFNAFFYITVNSPAFQTEEEDGRTRYIFPKIQMATSSCYKSSVFAMSYGESRDECTVKQNASSGLTCSATVEKNGDDFQVVEQQC